MRRRHGRPRWHFRNLRDLVEATAVQDHCHILKYIRTVQQWGWGVAWQEMKADKPLQKQCGWILTIFIWTLLMVCLGSGLYAALVGKSPRCFKKMFSREWTRPTDDKAKLPDKYIPICPKRVHFPTMSYFAETGLECKTNICQKKVLFSNHFLSTQKLSFGTEVGF